MNDLLSFRAIDRRLGYKLVRLATGKIEDLAKIRVQGGSFELTGTNQLPMSLTDGEALQVVQRWAALPAHEVVISACCCAKCHTEEAKAFQRSVGRVSHGIWPECMEAEMTRMMVDINKLRSRQPEAKKAA